MLVLIQNVWSVHGKLTYVPVKLNDIARPRNSNNKIMFNYEESVWPSVLNLIPLCYVMVTLNVWGASGHPEYLEVTICGVQTVPRSGHCYTAIDGLVTANDQDFFPCPNFYFSGPITFIFSKSSPYLPIANTVSRVRVTLLIVINDQSMFLWWVCTEYQ